MPRVSPKRGLAVTHGHACGKGTPEWWAWMSMKQRCRLDGGRQYASYRAKGIKVCPDWLESFEAFLRDVGMRPSPLHSLDRIDNGRDYEPGNCRWATSAQQMRNRGQYNRQLTFNGTTLCLSEWAERIGVRPGTLSERLRRGFTVEQALTFSQGVERGRARVALLTARAG